MRISKSKFVAGIQCLKRLYWQVHQSELAAKPEAADEARLEQGSEVGLLAHKRFPGGVAISSSGGLEQAIRNTRELVANHEIPAIFEGTFEHGGVLVQVDILQRRRDDRWRLLEVKSATDLKEHYLPDVAIQSRVVSGSGLDLASSCLMHVNRNYVFQGGPIDVQQFFCIRNLTRRIKKLQPKLTVQLRSELRMLDLPTAPDIAPGGHCSDPVLCEFFHCCNLPRPDDHIGYLPRMHASAIGELEGMGIASIHNIPDDFPLNERQRRACSSVQMGQAWYGPELKTELGRLKYPLCFMDFETINPAIPRFPGMRPYQHIPFQYSVHVQREPGAAPEHHEFLATEATDPRREFITSLCAALAKSGSIVVYHQPFEEPRLSELAKWLPEFAGRIKKIRGRLWDLLPFVRNHVYHPEFAGSYSLKYVLPALVPEMTYDGMAVAEGVGAGLAWESLVRGSLDQPERDRIEKALRAYCTQDTLALVRLVDKLRLTYA